MTMPEDLADFRERGTATQHLRRESVPKLMRAHRRRLDPGALERMANERSNAGRAQKPAARRAAAQKDATTGTPGSAVAEIGRNGCADISGQGKRSSVTALASD